MIGNPLFGNRLYVDQHLADSPLLALVAGPGALGRAAAAISPVAPITPALSGTAAIGSGLLPAPQGCTSACDLAGGGGLPSGLKLIDLNNSLGIQQLGFGVFSRAIGGIRALLSPPGPR